MDHGPPTDVPASGLVEFLKARPRPSKVVPFPVDGVEGTRWENVRVMVPPCDANGQAILAAHARMKKLMPKEEWGLESASAVLGDLTAKEMIARTCFEPHNYGTEEKPFYKRHFGNSEDVERSLSSDETAVLHALMLQVTFEIGPRLSVLTDEEVDAWIEVLKEGLDPLAYLVLPDLHVLIRGLVSRISKASASSDTSPSPDSPPLTLPDTSASSREVSMMGTISYGELPSRPSTGSSVSNPPMISTAAAVKKPSKRS
jgi:hypothetical protein